MSSTTSLAEAWEALAAEDPSRYPADARGPFMAGALAAMELRQKRGDAAVFAEIAQYGRVVGTAAEAQRPSAASMQKLLDELRRFRDLEVLGSPVRGAFNSVCDRLDVLASRLQDRGASR